MPSTKKKQANAGTEALFLPEVLLPEQLIPAKPQSREQSLMLAVLEDGIRCFQKAPTVARANKSLLHKQAQNWILQDDWTYLFSFNNVCQALNINPIALRERLLSQKFDTATPVKVSRSHRATCGKGLSRAQVKRSRGRKRPG